jgi:spore cortex formation protein SpoVR/YcgB (stage V sporulation)
MLPECERRFDQLEKQHADFLKDYVSDMEASRKDISEFREEMKVMGEKVGNTHDSVLNMSKDIEYLSKALTDEKSAREKERKEKLEEKESERLEHKADRRFLIATLISSGVSIAGLIITIIKLFI